MKAPETSLRILLVEDSEHDAELLLRRLRRAGLRVVSKRVASEHAFRAALAHSGDYDVIIMDYTVPGLDAPRALELVRELRIDLPCVVVSGSVGEEAAVQALRLGAADSLLKDRLARLPSAVQGAIERFRIQRELRARERLLQAILDHAPAMIFIKDLEGRYLVVNRDFHRHQLDPALDVVCRTDDDLFPPELARAYRANDRLVIASDEAMRFEERWYSRDGEHVSLAVKFPLREESGRVYATGGIATDITDLKRIERETRLLRDTATALSSAADLSGALGGILRSVCEATGWAFGQAWVRAPGGNSLAVSEAWHGAGAAAARFRAASLACAAETIETCMGESWSSAVFAQLDDLASRPGFARGEQAREAGYNAWAAFPVSANGEVKAVLEFLGPEPVPRNAETVALIALVAAQLGDAITSRRAAEERDRLFTLSHDLLCVMNFDGRLVQLNPGWERVLGWRPAELRGTTWRDLVHPGDLERSAAAYARLRAGGSLTAFENRFRRNDGSYRWIEWSASPSPQAQLVYAIGRDVTDGKEAEERFRATFNQAAVGIIHTGLDSRFLRVNDRFCDIVGYTREELLDLSFDEITHPEDVRASWRELSRLTDEAERAAQFEKRYLRKDGATVWVALTTTAARGTSGAPEYFITVAQDISERKRIEESRREAEERYRSLVEQSPDAIYLISSDRKIMFCNGAGAALLGAASPGQVVGRPAVDFVHPDSRAAVLERIQRLETSGGVVPPINHVLRRLDGSLVEVENTGAAMNFNGARVVQTIARDVTDRRRYEARIEYLATHDALTGLPNRALLADRLQQALPHARRTGRRLAVAMIDLDHFKFVNDSYGHSFGDRLLGAIAQRLQGALRDGDTLARIGGDEFIVLLPDLPRREDAVAATERLRASLEEPFELDGRALHATASIGLSLYPDDGPEAKGLEPLLSNADVAMYQAKERGRNAFQLFTPEMGARAVRRVETEAALRRALEREEFVLHLQPQVDLRSARIVGAEALVRWNDPARGLVPPGDFIPVAEETGLIVPIGEWVLNEACRTAASWTAAGVDGLRVSVNVSPRQFRSGALAQAVREALRGAGLGASALELELTESLIMDNAAIFISALRELREIGVGLSIDDFGTGYSSLSYLKQFPVDKLKIDQSFVRDIPADPDDAAIARAVIDLGHNLKLNVIAEGVETAAQIEFLRARGCDEAQGYYLGRPLPAERLLGILQRSPVCAALSEKS